jgi:CubicO group peptidase (beta-lactamase class C family)
MAISLKMSNFKEAQILIKRYLPLFYKNLYLNHLNNSLMKKLITSVLCLMLLMQNLQAQKTKSLKTATDTATAFDAYVQKSIKEWEIPGLAIVVVKNNKVVFKNSYGTTELGTGNKVNNQTLFACASTTKAMTATAMGILVDQGKVNWDDPVIKYLPSFRLYDPYVTTQMRVRDLFLHNSGVGNTDYLWALNMLSSDEIMERMQLVKPSYSFRAGFIYQNIFYGIAGQVIEKVSGMPWENYITKNIFQPLGMLQTRAKLGLVTNANIAKPHDKVEGKIQVIERDSADRIGAAGSVYSNIDEIALWMQCMLDSSKYEGGRLVSPDTWTTLLKPQTFVTESEFYPTKQLTKPNFTTYALGWFQQDYKGRKLNYHTGSLSGEIAIHGQMPEEKTGVYVFANLDHAEARHGLMFKAFDQYALGGNTDWSADFLTLYGNIRAKAAAASAAQEATRVLNTKPSLALTAYVGTYADPLFGSITISIENETLVGENIKLGKGAISHWNYDTFQLAWDKKWYGKTGLNFRLNQEGKVSSVEMDGVSLAKN